MTEIFYVKKFPGNAYRYVDTENGLSLQTAPMFKNGCIDHEQSGEVESPEPIFKEVCLHNYSRYPYE